MKEEDKPKRMILTMISSTNEDKENVIDRLTDNTPDSVEARIIATIIGASGTLQPSIPWVNTTALTIEEDMHLILIQNTLAQHMDSIDLSDLRKQIRW